MSQVALARVDGAYPTVAPYPPDRAYPELGGTPVGDEANPVFDGVRALLRDLGLDRDRFGTPAWNPLRGVVRPGDTVFIKPNMVDHEHRFGADLWSVVTHPAVVRAVVDYVALALEGRGSIVVGDNPHVDCDFDALARHYRPDLLAAHVQEQHGVSLRLIDLREWQVRDLSLYGFARGREPLPGDPRGRVEVDLGRRSCLEGVPWWLLRGTLNERRDTLLAHFGGHHRYVFSRSIFDADVFVSIPKLKAHAKVGATLNVKGLIGTIAEKNALVHWRLGFPRFGGDEYPNPEDAWDLPRLYGQHALWTVTPSRLFFELRKRLAPTPLGAAYRGAVQCQAQRIRMLRGAWEGNDTTWRMAVDVFHAFVDDLTGARRRAMRFLSVVDGITAGDTDGPHFPDPRAAGMLVAGTDLLAVDLVSLRLMDFRLPVVRHLAHLAAERDLDPTRIPLVSSSYEVADFFADGRQHLAFKPPHRWPRLSLHGLEPGPSYLPLGP